MQRCNLNCFISKQIQLRNSRLLILEITSLGLKTLRETASSAVIKKQAAIQVRTCTYLQETVVFTNSKCLVTLKERKTINRPYKYCSWNTVKSSYLMERTQTCLFELRTGSTPYQSQTTTVITKLITNNSTSYPYI